MVWFTIELTPSVPLITIQQLWSKFIHSTQLVCSFFGRAIYSELGEGGGVVTPSRFIPGLTILAMLKGMQELLVYIGV